MDMRKVAFALGVDQAIEEYIKCARAPAGMSIPDLQALRDSQYADMEKWLAMGDPANRGMTLEDENELKKVFLENFRLGEIPTEDEQRRAARVGGGVLGGIGGTALGASIGALFKRPGLGALIGAPTGAAAGVGLGSLRGTNKYPSLDEVGVGPFAGAAWKNT